MTFASLALAAALGPACWPGPVAEKYVPVESNYFVNFISYEHQENALAELKENSLTEVDQSILKKSRVDNALVDVRYYYLARAGYVGPVVSEDSQLKYISVSMVIDQDYKARIYTFGLSMEKSTHDIAVVIGSDIALTGVKSVCTAAE